ncbi:MAG TPA: serine hydrolase domain-containing protein [Croceibacterium sp.]|jgi:CubicO group peptidase (beta-lactamase class C family)
MTDGSLRMTPFDVQLSRRQWLGGAAIAGVTLGWPGLSRAQDSAAEWPHVEQLIQSYVGGHKVANMVAPLGWGQQAPAVLAQGTLALGGTQPASADSLYRWYSMTKPITGMAAMILIDEGKLALDQPLHEIIPAFKSMQVQKAYDGPITPDNLEPATRPITIRMLLTHTSGLGYAIIQKGPLRKAYLDRGIVPAFASKLPIPELHIDKSVDGLAEFADAIAQMPLVYQPGTRWSYSAGLDVMGRVIEVVSGQAFDAFLQQRIFGPTGMTSTWFQVPRSEVARLTTNYAVVNDLLVPIDMPANSIFLDPPPVKLGGGGLAGSPRDYDRFLQMLAGYGSIDGKRVMSEAAVRMGTSNLMPESAQSSAPGSEVSFDAQRYGFGAGGRVGKGAETGIYGWAGAAGTIGFVDMRRGLRGGLFAQFMPDSAYPLHTGFPAAVAADVVSRKAAA